MSASRGATWTNSDGLVVGFGPQYPERLYSGDAKRVGTGREIRVQVTYQSTFGASGAKASIPANSNVKNVYFKVGTAWTGGTSLSVGDTNGAAGFLTTTALAQASMTASKIIQADGTYAVGNNAANMGIPKNYATALDVYFTSVGTWTAGDGVLVIELE